VDGTRRFPFFLFGDFFSAGNSRVLYILFRIINASGQKFTHVACLPQKAYPGLAFLVFSASRPPPSPGQERPRSSREVRTAAPQICALIWLARLLVLRLEGELLEMDV